MASLDDEKREILQAYDSGELESVITGSEIERAMIRNPILEELYAAREKLLADAGNDVRKYLEGVRQREASSGRLLLPSPETKPECPERPVSVVK